MSGPVIETPRGRIVVGKNGKAELSWNTNFRPKWQRRYSAAQRFVDSEVLRDCEPYTPLRTSMLIKSGTLGTEIGSGTVKWIAPYAHRQYYLVRKTKSETGPLRGSYWFRKAKAVHLHRWIAGARRRAGGGSA
ncbi:MAG TPA: minor capsid protein [Anaerolineaceae bacterium]|nr:minor capsid protein [Anaerolineaceae bacterium]